ncbi:hypothetical protein ACHAXT_007452 [Thalassiosira profunda]
MPARRRACRMAAAAAAIVGVAPAALAFSHVPPRRLIRAMAPSALFMSGVKFDKIDEDDDQVMAFMDVDGDSGIDCYVDSYATVEGVEYTIGSPCDYAVALCYFQDDDQLIPIELDDPLMDDVFPIAEGIIEDEFQDELVLLRTPQTLTLVGELEENEDEEDEDMDDGGDEMNDTEEEVEILVSFEEDGQEYHLVRLLDPVLLVGKAGNENTRILLTPEESDKVMPMLEDMFMSYTEDGE